MRIIILSVCVLGLLLLFFRGLRGSIFEVSLARRNVGGIFMFRELFLMITLGVLIFETIGYENFVTFYITSESLEQTSVVILTCLGILIITLAFISKNVFPTQLMWSHNTPQKASTSQSSIALVYASSALLLMLVIIAHAAGMKHAFLQSILGGTDLMKLRLANVTDMDAPQHIIAYIRYLFQLIALLLGLYTARIPKPMRMLIMVLVLYAASLPGDKAPIIQVLFLYFIGRFKSSHLSPLASLRRVLALSTISIGAIYLVTLVQYPEMGLSEFMDFIFERLGIGQIQGVYEQFAVRLRNSDYIFSEIPLSGIFGETIAFSKDLMAATYGYYMDRSDFGVMNSFFIGEAYAIGGWLLVWLSPIIVGVNFCSIVYMVVRILNLYFKLPLEEAKYIAALFVSGSVTFTGDLGGLLFGKRIIVIGILFLVIYPCYRFAKKIFGVDARG